MKYRFFHIPALDSEAEETALNDFCARHRVASVEKSLVVNGLSSYWAVCVTYQDGTSKLPVVRKGRIDYREVLNEADFAIFARLRTLRKELAENEGVPAYALFTNEQLAGMVTGRVTNAADLQAIEGVGEGKMHKYGEAFLALLTTAFEGGGEGASHAKNSD